jgi:putative nucleotidyltransferase with HDIG domain
MLARAIAEDLGEPKRNVERTETAALLHDIGKIDSVYEAVIRKPYDLNASERELIRTHATKGADLLESLSSVSAEVIKAVRHHHERYDGSGYPSGLKGEEIPLAARIIMLCDSIDAMLSDRPYRKALSLEKTRLELIRCSGTQFDPTIVRVILQQNTLERAAWVADRPDIVPADSPLSNTA